ncbi:MAG TPA: protein kinase [Candidatus Acidoferrales bacterium]|nr:protein kinase [Candidatus Acidoferrales bacterium]
MSGDEFKGTDRYVVQRRLGRGGFGVVYQVWDRRQDAVVALKTLHRSGADALFRFKQEFRALADIHHPNLVSLYELVSDGTQWFFTMELVAGVDFLAWVAGSEFPDSETRATQPVSDTKTATLPGTLPVGGGGEGPECARLACPSHPARVREAVCQLAEGILELHRAGKLHRDIKPSNVLVTREGRVVILDFGLVAEMEAAGHAPANPPAGTPSYIAPEVADGHPALEAADWYAVGVMLFEALTGRRPFEGTSAQIIAHKQRLDAPAPSAFAGGIPPDLESLCRDLLQRDPLRRPSGVEILRRAGAPDAERTNRFARVPFVGRELQLGLLRQAFDSACRSLPAVVLVHGPSGIGKSSLVNRFLGELANRGGAISLKARCLERESVPYKAFDSIMDGLARYLKQLTPGVLNEIRPPDMHALTRLFPVLREVEYALSAPEKSGGIADPKELRQRAFAAFRDLFLRLARHRVVVLFLDDLQWGDPDSAGLLADLLQRPAPSRLLLIAVYRHEDAAAGPMVQALRRIAAQPGAEVSQIPLQGLSMEESEHLANEIGGVGGKLGGNRAEAIARESGGNPLFITQLAEKPQTAGESLSLDQLIQTRFSRLDDPARRLMEVVAVAGRPIEMDMAKSAAQHHGPDYNVIAALRGGRLIRLRTGGERNEIEAYHDRIREAVCAVLPPQVLTGCHARLANVLEAAPRPDLEMLAIHFRGAGDLRKASRYALAGAEQAENALAFESAARLCRFALELGMEDAATRRAVQVRLGDALANAGRGAEAAEAYLAASGGSAADEALECRRQAAGHLLMSGHLQRGIAVLREVLLASGMRLAPAPWRALASILFRRAWIRVRGLGFREQDVGRIPRQEIVRIDTCWSVAQGLGMVDTIRAADFQARHLLLALRAGEPYRVSRALAVEAAYHALAGGRREDRTRALLATNRTLAERIQQQHPHALGLATMVEGMAAFLEGRWMSARQLHERAEVILRERCRGVAWELATVHLMWSVAVFFLGELDLLARRLPGLLKEAEARGDLYEATDLRIRISHANWLAADDPEAARREVGEAIARWPGGEFYVQHWWSLIANVEIALYAGQGEAAWELISKEWPRLKRSLLMRVQYIRIESLYHRGAAALAVAAAAPDARRRSNLLKSALADARGIARERMPWSDPLAQLLEAGVAAIRGDRERAGALLLSAESGFDRADMRLYSAAARRCRGALMKDAKGRELLEAADAWMMNQKIRNPARMTAMLTPGAWAGFDSPSQPLAAS